MNNDKYLVVISGPSGAGKDTVAGKMRELHPEIEVSVSATSRAMRPGEAEGVNYFYLSRQEFEQWIHEDKIVEHTEYCGSYYGTPRSEIDWRIANGITVVLVIEVEGAQNIKRLYPDATTIFICPPTMQELERRLRGRGTDNETQIQARLERAKWEMTFAPTYDEQVVNVTVEQCANDLYALIRKHQDAPDK